jgi:O-antigen/teichoic acid export membrane protein
MSDGVYTFALRIANVAAAAALGILTARLLGPAGKGVYALPMIQAGLVATVFGGLASATSYYLLNTTAGPRAALTAAIQAAIPLTILAAAGICAVAALGGAWWAVPAAIGSLPATAAINIAIGYIVGIKRVRFATTLTLACTLSNLALAGLGLFLVARTPQIAIVAWITSLSAVAAIALGTILLHAWRTPAGTERISLPAYLRLAGKVGAVGVVTLLNYRADLYIVALFLPLAALGIYTVAISAAESLLVPTQIAALVTSPHIGGLPREAAAQLAARCVRNNLLGALPVCGFIFAFSPFLIQLLYGTAFLPLVPALRILLVGVVALSLGSPVSTYYTLKLAKPEVTFAIASCSAILCIACSLWLVPRMGIAGAAIASTVAYIAGQGAGLAYFSRDTGIAWRTILVPTIADFQLYRDFLSHSWLRRWTLRPTGARSE